MSQSVHEGPDRHARRRPRPEKKRRNHISPASEIREGDLVWREKVLFRAANDARKGKVGIRHPDKPKDVAFTVPANDLLKALIQERRNQ